MKKYNFNQAEVLMIGLTKQRKDAAWKRFMSICDEFGFKVSVTGGAFLTHQIEGADHIDFEAVIELVAGV